MPGFAEDDDPYTACAACGKQVFAGVSICPYCHEDPSGEYFICTYCDKRLPAGTVQCPYCKNYTDGGGGGVIGPSGKKIPKVYIVAGWLVVLCLLLPLLLALYDWLNG